MDRLSGLDASFLYLETPSQLLHVCGVILLDPATIPEGYSFDAFKDELERRVEGCRCSTASSSRSRSTSTTRCGSTTRTSTSTGTCTGWPCRRLVGEGARRPVRSHGRHPAGPVRALWEFVVIEGLESGKVAVFTKMHHCTVDGVSGANLISFLCSLEPDAPPLETPTGSGGPPGPRATPSCSPGVWRPTWRSRSLRPSWSRRRPACSPRRSTAPAAVRRWPRR